MTFEFFLYKAIYTLINLCQLLSLVISMIRKLSFFKYLNLAINFDNLEFNITFTI